MEKRPLSLTIIGWLLVVFTLPGIYSVVTMGSNPVAMKMLEQMHISLAYEQAWSVLGAVVNGSGTGEGQFIETNYMAWDKQGNLYTGDTSVGRVTEMVAPKK